MDVVKSIAWRWIPPVFMDSYYAFKGTGAWNGVYSSFADVPVSGPGYASEYWRNVAIGEAKEYMEGAPSRQERDDIAPLLLLAGSLVTEGRSLRILDCGGGVGTAYILLPDAVKASPLLDFHVAEQEWACTAGRAILNHGEKVHFHAGLPDTGTFDVINFAAALQYIDDWAGTLKRIARYNPRYVIASNIFHGDFATFATGQKNIPGSVIACWYFNSKQVIDVMKSEGYALLFNGLLSKTFDQRGLPASLRTPEGRASALLFVRET